MDLGAKNTERIWAKGQGVYEDFKLALLVFVDEQCRCGTDAKSQFGFGGSLGLSIVPEPEPNVQHSLRYYIDGRVKGRFPTASSDEVPTIIAPPRAPIFQDGMIWGEGLFCMLKPSG